MTEQELSRKLFTDEAFRAEMKRDPKGTLQAHGIEVPDDVEIDVVESTPTKHYVVLPPLKKGELSEADIAAVQGGNASSIRCTDAFQDTVCI